jgi:outer membrane protein assembly factor BamE (lipoprotein component of BamABCDE complex)
MRIMIVALAAAGLAACSSSGVRVSVDQLEQLRPGETTYQQAYGMLGEPTLAELHADGTRTIAYTYSESSARPENFVPFINLIVGGYDMRSSTITLNFGQNGLLRDRAVSATAYGVTDKPLAGATAAARTYQPR